MFNSMKNLIALGLMETAFVNRFISVITSKFKHPIKHQWMMGGDISCCVYYEHFEDEYGNLLYPDIITTIFELILKRNHRVEYKVLIPKHVILEGAINHGASSST